MKKVQKEIKNIFLEEVSLTDIFFELLNENTEYIDYIKNVINDVLSIGANPNDRNI